MSALIGPVDNRRCPWADYQTPEHVKTCGDNMSNYSVTWFMSTSAPGMHGWRTTTRSFPTEAEALAAGHRMMGTAFEVVVYEWNWKLPFEDNNRRKTIYSRKNKNQKRR